jgi:hypothetical protein
MRRVLVIVLFLLGCDRQDPGGIPGSPPPSPAPGPTAAEQPAPAAPVPEAVPRSPPSRTFVRRCDTDGPAPPGGVIAELPSLDLLHFEPDAWALLGTHTPGGYSTLLLRLPDGCVVAEWSGSSFHQVSPGGRFLVLANQNEAFRVDTRTLASASLPSAQRLLFFADGVHALQLSGYPPADVVRIDLESGSTELLARNASLLDPYPSALAPRVAPPALVLILADDDRGAGWGRLLLARAAGAPLVAGTVNDDGFATPFRSADGDRVVFQEHSGDVVIFHVSSGSREVVEVPPGAEVALGDVAPDGEHLILRVGAHPYLRATSGALVQLPDRSMVAGWSPSSSGLVTAVDAGVCGVGRWTDALGCTYTCDWCNRYTLRTADGAHELDLGEAAGAFPEFSPDGKRVLVHANTRVSWETHVGSAELQLVDLEHAKLVAELGGTTAGTGINRFDEQGEALVVIDDQLVRVDPASGSSEVLGDEVVFESGGGGIYLAGVVPLRAGVAFLADTGRGWDGRLMFWDRTLDIVRELSRWAKPPVEAGGLLLVTDLLDATGATRRLHLVDPVTGLDQELAEGALGDALFAANPRWVFVRESDMGGAPPRVVDVATGHSGELPRGGWYHVGRQLALHVAGGSGPQSLQIERFDEVVK